MSILIALLLFIALATFSYLGISVYAATADPMELRLRSGENPEQRRTDMEEVLAKPFSQRFLAPLAQKTLGIVGASPVGITRYVEKKLLKAGGMAGLSAAEYIALTGLLLSLLIIISAGAAFFFHFNAVVALCYGAVIGVGFPFFMLSRKITARQNSIQKDLPDILDMITISVEAGLSFDGALAKLNEKMQGTLVDEFTRVLQEMRMGMSRRDALKAMRDRCDNKDLSLFISALLQANKLGVSIGSILRAQAAAIRQSRRNQLEQKANKATIKLLFPLVACIFPMLFIVLMGPAMLQILDLL